MVPTRKVHPKCINASNPFHECSEYCLKRIAAIDSGASQPTSAGEPAAPLDVQLPAEFGQQKKWKGKAIDEAIVAVAPPVKASIPPVVEESKKEEEEEGEKEAKSPVVEESLPDNFESMNPMQKKLFELRLKLNQARKANQSDANFEKKRQTQPEESRGVSKKKWFEDKKRRVEKQLEANGLDISHAYMLDTQENAEEKYKKWEKKEAPFGWDVFNQASLYKAYKKRTKTIQPDMEAYNAAKSSDPEFYRDDSSLKYGEGHKDSEANIQKMVQELEDRGNKRKEFSRRRKYHDDKDIDSINDRNEHFNRKIERAFGKYTVEIKNNLERGTALPD